MRPYKRRARKSWLRDRIAPGPAPVWSGPVLGREQIRVAYLSADFHKHPTAYLTAGLFEQHDRSRFEVIGMSFGPDDGSDIRARLMRGFEEFLRCAGERRR